MTGRLLLDLTHTSHTRARTGVQRVVRGLHRELGERALAVTHDPYLRGWRPLEKWEHANLAATHAAQKRGATWPLAARVRGRWRRASGRGANRELASARGFVTAEIFSAAVGRDLPATGPRVAVFHDAIALRLPEFTPAGTVARFPSYLQELLQFDGIAAVSDDSRMALVDYWRWLGVSRPPPVVTLSLGVDLPVSATPAERPAGRIPVVLSVGTLEGRKNHVALLEACAQLWETGEVFQLRIAGAVQTQTGRAALAKVRALQQAGWPVRYEGPLADAEVDRAYAECAFTVYPSVAEGFGLPVIESLAHGRPCICSGKGALGELSRHGGCVPLDSVDAAALAPAIQRLLAAPEECTALAAAARRRTFKTWRDYARELEDWIATLPRPSY